MIKLATDQYVLESKQNVKQMATFGLIIQCIIIVTIMLTYLLWRDWLLEILSVAVILCVWKSKILNFYELLHEAEINMHMGKFDSRITQLERELEKLRK